MTGSRPRRDDDATDFERRWLSAARTEEPPPEVVARIERALGLGPGGAASSPARTDAAVSAARRGLSALRVGTLSVLGIGGVVGVVLWLSQPAPPPLRPDRPHAPDPVAASAPPLPPPSRSAAPAAPATVAADTIRTDTIRTDTIRTDTIRTDTMRDELLLVDGARAALAAGSPARALSLLERYRARYPHGILRPEALAMRIEAIDRTGEHTRARALARAFLAEYPDSPLRQRVARLAGP